MRPLPAAWALGLALCLAAQAEAGEPAPAEAGEPAPAEASEPASRHGERMARYGLETARGLRREGRLELAEAAARRGLSFAPDDARLHRELARILGELGRADAAARERATADALDPPHVLPAATPLEIPSRGVLVLLVPPDRDTDPSRLPQGWPDEPVARTLEARLRTRLPQAEVVHASPESVKAARGWLSRFAPRAALSLRVDRVYCGDTVKDGAFGIAWLRAAAETPGAASTGPAWARAWLNDPRLPAGCRVEVTTHALEQVLKLPSVRDALAAPAAASGAWSTASIRALFPGLGARIDQHLAEGHELLSQGRVDAAAAAFRRAREVDPDDTVVRSYLHEAEATLALARELDGGRGRSAGGDLDPRYTAAQRAALEARLAEERRLRQDLLTALAVMDEDVRLPEPRFLARLRPVSVRDGEAFGPTLARRRAGGEVEARAAFTPDGAEIARYYFPSGSDLPVLREEDTTRDGHADRWLAYAGDTRSEIWEDGQEIGYPDVRLVFADGKRLLRVELDRNGDGRAERIFRYAGGSLSSEARDTNGDGTLDTFEHFDAEGQVDLREEDRDGDGGIDVRSIYQRGRLVRREISSPEGG